MTICVSTYKIIGGFAKSRHMPSLIGGKDMDYKDIYKEWLSNPYFDEDTKKELQDIITAQTGKTVEIQMLAAD